MHLAENEAKIMLCNKSAQSTGCGCSPGDAGFNFNTENVKKVRNSQAARCPA